MPPGIYLRMCRSIQAEGAFTLLKTDFGFRRFLTRGKASVRTELFFLGIQPEKAMDEAGKWSPQTHLSEIRIA